MLFADVDGQDHKRQFRPGWDIEPAVDVLEGHSGGERPEGFAHLDHGVDPVAHLGLPRIGQDAPMSERPRAELHRAAVPGDHPSVADQRGGGGTRLAQTGDRTASILSPNCASAASISCGEAAGPKNGTGIRSFRTVRSREARHSAAPSAEPSSPAAGWT